MTYESNSISPRLMDLIEYEDNADPSDPLNYLNLNELCADFILNDQNLEILKMISNALKKLVSKHTNLVS